MKYKAATTTAASTRMNRSVLPKFCFKVCLDLCDNVKEGIHTVRCLNGEKDSGVFGWEESGFELPIRPSEALLPRLCDRGQTSPPERHVRTVRPGGSGGAHDQLVKIRA